VKYAYIQEHSAQWKVGMLCEMLEVSTSGYHAFVARPSAEGDTRLLTHIRAQHARSRGAYGWPRMWQAPRKDGIKIGKERTRVLMQRHDIRGRQKRRYVTTTQRAHADPVAENLLNRQFTPTAINQTWAGDITYIATDEGWLFLATVIDLASRKLVGYALADHMRAELAIEALTRAAWRRKPPPGFIFHSDQGSQYTSAAFRETLQQLGGQASMSRRGNCWDNAPSESLFGSLKTERIFDNRYATHEEAKADVLQWIAWYNNERLHSTLGYLNPTEFEQRMKASITPKAA
jgi:putative transposase